MRNNRLLIIGLATLLLGAGCLLKPYGWPASKSSLPESAPSAASAAATATSTAPLAPVTTLPKAPVPPKPKTTPSASASTTKPANGYVTLLGFKFGPQILAVNTGATVYWTNKDAANHTVDSDAVRIFNSGNLSPGGMFMHVFNSPGTYTYHCSVHPEMTGTIVVR